MEAPTSPAFVPCAADGCTNTFVFRKRSQRYCCRECLVRMSRKAYAERAKPGSRLGRASVLEPLADEPDATPAELAEMPPRPRCRAECVDGPRPCPWYGCRHHLGLDVTPTGRIVASKIGDETCALDLAERGGLRFDKVATALGVAPERIRQIAITATSRLRASREGSPIAPDGYDPATWVPVPMTDFIGQNRNSKENDDDDEEASDRRWVDDDADGDDALVHAEDFAEQSASGGPSR